MRRFRSSALRIGDRLLLVLLSAMSDRNNLWIRECPNIVANIKSSILDVAGSPGVSEVIETEWCNGGMKPGIAVIPDARQATLRPMKSPNLMYRSNS